ncbi:MAG: hypothetical protein WAT81_02480 [Candidatus Moraniibacteriota bacterium]
MPRTIRITCAPPEANPELAPALIDLTVRLRPELVALTSDPAIGADALIYFVHNDDIRAALAEKLGIAQSSRYHPFLEVGRATRIHHDCCTGVN